MAYDRVLHVWSHSCPTRRSADLVIGAEQQVLLLRPLAVGDLLVHFCPATSCSRLAPSTILPAPALLILIVRTSGSTTWRLRSTCSNPRSRVAPVISIPSASTKLRWNWRAAMPRCR